MFKILVGQIFGSNKNDGWKFNKNNRRNRRMSLDLDKKSLLGVEEV